jgi:hypothetical protein
VCILKLAGHWLGLGTGSSRLGPVQPTWAELDPTSKKLKKLKIKKNICIHKNKFILFVYSVMLEL